MIIEEETYDPLCQVQKIFLLKNGLLDIPNIKIKDTSCIRCEHSITEHLDGTGVCLCAVPICLCLEFVERLLWREGLTIDRERGYLGVAGTAQSEAERRLGRFEGEGLVQINGPLYRLTPQDDISPTEA